MGAKRAPIYNPASGNTFSRRLDSLKCFANPTNTNIEKLSNGSTAANGFAALKDLDSNGDGVFDIKDAAFTELVVWRDVNGNKIAA